MQLEWCLEHSARRFPSKPALIFEGRSLSYGELDSFANELAYRLQRRGVNRGDRVLIWLDNSIDAVVAVFGILKAGAVFVPLNCSTKPAKVRFVSENCSATGLITDLARAHSLNSNSLPGGMNVWICPEPDDSLCARYGDMVDGVRTEVDGPTADAPTKRCIDVDLAALIYTSGSSGIPKGVMLTHLNMTSAAASITTYLGICADDVILNVLPLAFDYGLYQLFLAFGAGATVVLHRSFTYPSVVIELFRRHAVTIFPVVPTMIAILAKLGFDSLSLPSLRLVTSTGAALSLKHIEAARRLFPSAKFYSMYGLTECKRVSYLPPELLESRPLSVGRGMPNQEIYLIDAEGNRVREPGTGELVVRGSHVMKGYWNAPEETGRALRPGPLPGESVLHTGDLFRIDADGFLYFIGRKDDMIKCRGERVSPREVEDVIQTLAGVAEVAVVGVDDPVLGQAIRAYVVPESAHFFSESDVRRHCATHLERYAIPDQIELVLRLPRNDRGKIDKCKLGVVKEDRG